MKPDCHHPFFERKAQSKTPEGKYIVNAPSFPILMDYDVHHYELHPNCNKLPVLQRKSIEIVAANFEPVDNPLITIDHLMLAFLKAEHCGELDYNQQKLAYISVECLKKQLPFIRDGMVKR